MLKKEALPGGDGETVVTRLLDKNGRIGTKHSALSRRLRCCVSDFVERGRETRQQTVCTRPLVAKIDSNIHIQIASYRMT